MCVYACLRSSLCYACRASECVRVACVCERACREPWVSLSPHGEATAHNPKQPPFVRPAGIAASPGAPMGGAPTPNVEIPLERSEAVRPTVLIGGGGSLVRLAGSGRDAR